MSARRTCTVYRGKCAEHGFVHGAEAEELRTGIEKIVREALGRCPPMTDVAARVNFAMCGPYSPASEIRDGPH